MPNPALNEVSPLPTDAPPLIPVNSTYGSSTAGPSTFGPRPSTFPNTPWNIYFRSTMLGAIQQGLIEKINSTRGTHLTPEQFLADCRARAGSEEIFQQAYMCNPAGDAANHIVDWSAIERCRFDYEIDRLDLDANQIRSRFGEFSHAGQRGREQRIEEFIHESFPSLFKHAEFFNQKSKSKFKNSFPSLFSVRSDSPIQNQNSKFKNPSL
jgi:hypothetical protein